MKLKRIIWIVVVLLVCLILFRIVVRLQGGKVVQEERSVSVVAVIPTIGTISDRLILTGDVKGEMEVSVRPKMAGRVEEIYVQEGDWVNKETKLLSYVSGIKPDNDLYEDMVVKSPIDGVVGMQLVKVGEQVTSQVTGMSPVFMVYGINSIKIYADVPEKYYSKIAKGTVVAVSFDAYPGEVFRGKIANVRPVIDPLSRTTQVEIRMANANHRIKPGMFARVDLVLSSKSGAMILPFDAVLGGDEPFVFVAENSVAVKKPVKLGIMQNNDIEIISGITPNDKVITVGQRVVKEGSKIEEEKQ
ncbi:MAG: efflux RND transporter periplasmic adaptor subunit [Candidatus Saganbacteria bacterium]|nr:efflux RND transporter periplasmic adaptor subunit [Candidatus Saganbacteria bacterium]